LLAVSIPASDRAAGTLRLLLAFFFLTGNVLFSYWTLPRYVLPFPLATRAQ